MRFFATMMLASALAVLPIAATINPELYRRDQGLAPEQVLLTIDSVQRVLSGGVRTFICRATVESVKTSTSGLKPGSRLTLKLSLPEPSSSVRRAGCGAPPALPPPVVGQSYYAYLQRRGGTYVPAAGWLSLVIAE
jgi:hypothetical protein